ncbi:nucleotidyl transferase AbiEii/AbiGii toxin family protein [Cryomorpha ignava]|uniref:Nucleotidyl transferase AbiEii/AbiGii toxin family protein n=1 Tax=Cryomorpha ignava TaxID=101383 RepID=A0A7K3WMT6_9FLAO|nr:nucleotidyl transferase AbiEii/AbiGii toxin family protein [Cryomorpha ignava]NEN22311.1 nucleotidyl transferase AbiEii/AbiGii toxin family protein [Cryomorpha ignava]
MLPRRYIDECKEFAHWLENAQVEQDLVIEKAMMELFSDPFLKERLAFRGGTALHKIFLKPQVRYSEDIDLVQIRAKPIKDTISVVRKQLDFLGKPVVKQKANNNTLVYRFESEIPPVVNLRLKIEINCREHFTVLGYKEIEHKIENSWTNGFCKLTAFEVEEMLGTKLRALYQRKKGRDLFDLYHALTNLDLDTGTLIKCYQEYMAFSVDKPHTQNQFLRNMEEKLKDPDFEGDIFALLRPGIEYDQAKAYELIKTELIEKI